MPNIDLRGKVESLPYAPGVYLMKSAEGEILYIGKAISLRKRVRSYLKPNHEIPKIPILMSRVREIDHIETPTEVDALLLEARLIRKYQPRYNKELKDDKSFPLLKITSDAFPRILMTRNKSDKKAHYYGPFTDAKLLREAVTLINHLFPLRKCRRLPKKACLYYHIGQCLAPCIKPEVKEDYDQQVNEVKTFLGSGKKSFIEYITDKMQDAADELRFEDAQYFKEQIEALSRLKKKRFSPSAEDASIALSASLELRKFLALEKLPENIVCFDVSNLQGEEAVASKVAFYRELPDKMGYRRYKIKTVQGINDYAMIQEAVRRMLVGIKEGREEFIPDIIMIDGGKGHLHAAREVLAQEGFETTALISIAKRFEIIYSAKTDGEIAIPRDSPSLHLLQKIRDEAHRFAITYHRSLKEKGMSRSELDEIEGIGEARKRILLQQFESLEEIKRAGIDQLAGLPGMNVSAAQKIWNHFHS
ncbi:MAG: excinuclease ABC subunit UvrC [Candidatus Omnitrophica bacterium]|nr:excinuclease ABC subunit UvrC [Candidatus Omnitrophota bacterium]